MTNTGRKRPWIVRRAGHSRPGRAVHSRPGRAVHSRPGRAVLVSVTAAMVLLVGLGAPAAVAGTTWSTYHGDLSRSGVDASEAGLSPVRQAWTAPLDGAAVYGSPVVADGRVFVATEDDDVYALDAHDGHILWSANIGAPLRDVAGQTGCGDIDPLGITSTPAVDTATSTLYVAGEVSHAGSVPVQHLVVGFNLFTGQTVLRKSADPVGGGDSLPNLQQRAALAVANGRVYVGLGGLAGDCGTYHGWVVGVDETGSRPNVQFDVTPGFTGGAVWNGGGGPSVDSQGDLYVTTGNQNSGAATQTPYAEAVVKLSPNLSVLAHFQDSHASGDADLGTGDALLLPDGDLWTAGKTDIGYLLRQSNLTQAHAITGTVCGSDPDGGSTYDAATDSVYVPCRGGGLQQIDLATDAIGWRSGSVNSSPILVDGGLWAGRAGSNVIQELNPASGTVMQQVDTANGLPTFATASAADGLLLIGTDAGIEAFDGPGGPPPPAPPPPAPAAGYRLVARDGGVFAFGRSKFYGGLGGIHLSAPIVGAVATPSGNGYWLVASDGGVFAFGDARFYGSTGGVRLTQPVVGIAAAPNGQGYWLVARDGGVFAFGPGARFAGSTGRTRLNAPVVAMAADVATGGYWLFASDGGVFSFDARFYGSTGGIRLARPVVGAAASGAGRGYWMVASDGGVFDYGPGAAFHGSTGGTPDAPVVGMATDSRTGGYWLTETGGQVVAFDAPFEGSVAGTPLTQPVVAITGS